MDKDRRDLDILDRRWRKRSTGDRRNRRITVNFETAEQRALRCLKELKETGEQIALSKEVFEKIEREIDTEYYKLKVHPKNKTLIEIEEEMKQIAKETGRAIGSVR